MYKLNRFIEYSIYIIATLALILFLISFSIVTFELNKIGSNFCLNNQCIKNFYDFYEYVIKIPMAGIAVITILFAWHAANSYFHTYVITAENNLNTQKVNQQSTYLQHYKFFCELLDECVEKVDYINIKNIDKFNLYHFIFDQAKNGDFNVSNSYKEYINYLNKNISDLKNQIIKNKENTDHIKNMVIKLSEIGFNMPECPRKDFIKLEVGCYDLLSLINKCIDVEIIDEPSHCI